MKNKIIYYIPYIPIIGMIYIFFNIDKDYCINNLKNKNNIRDFYLSMVVQVIGWRIPIIYLLQKYTIE